VLKGRQLFPVMTMLVISHRGYVFSIGEIVLKDSGKNLLNDDKVKEAFLGG